MNTYEALLVFKPILDVENVDAILNQFQKAIVEGNKGEIVEVDRIGRKRLAFEIKRFKDGFLALYLLKMPANKVADFRRACQLNEDILRVTMLRVDETVSLSNREESRRETGFRGGRGGRGDARDNRDNRDNRGDRDRVGASHHTDRSVEQ